MRFGVEKLCLAAESLRAGAGKNRSTIFRRSCTSASGRRRVDRPSRKQLEDLNWVSNFPYAIDVTVSASPRRRGCDPNSVQPHLTSRVSLSIPDKNSYPDYSSQIFCAGQCALPNAGFRVGGRVCNLN